jgi:thiol-disulfide isomerase/thioredoxin
MQKKILIAFLAFLSATALEFMLTPVRAKIGFTYSLVIGFFVLAFGSLLFFRKGKALSPYWISAFLFMGISVVHLPPRLIDFKESFVSFPEYLGHTLALVIGLLFHFTGKWQRWLWAGLGTVAVLFMFFKGYKMVFHHLNFGSFTGNYRSPLPSFVAEFQPGRRITSDSLAGKTTLVDLWHTRCGICFRKFPLLEKTYQQYKNNPAVSIIALNVPLTTDRATQAFDMISTRGYTFPVAKLQTMPLLDSLGVLAFPTTIIVDKKGQVIFKGGLENGVKRLKRIARL